MRVILPGVGLYRGVGLHRATSSDTTLLTESQIHTFAGDARRFRSLAWNRRMIATSYYYKITFDGEVIGGLVVARPDWDRFHLARIWVDPAHQGQGIGSRALALAEARFPQATLWTVDVPEWARRCRHFFATNGYRAADQTRPAQAQGTVRYQKPRRGLLHLRSLP